MKKRHIHYSMLSCDFIDSDLHVLYVLKVADKSKPSHPVLHWLGMILTIVKHIFN